MRQTTLKRLKDNQHFKLSKRSKVLYEMVTKKKGMATFTSLSSELSFVRSVDTVCWI